MIELMPDNSCNSLQERLSARYSLTTLLNPLQMETNMIFKGQRGEGRKMRILIASKKLEMRIMDGTTIIANARLFFP